VRLKKLLSNFFLEFLQYGTKARKYVEDQVSFETRSCRFQLWFPAMYELPKYPYQLRFKTLGVRRPKSVVTELDVPGSQPVAQGRVVSVKARYTVPDSFTDFPH
jgi:hypothetical protein